MPAVSVCLLLSSREDSIAFRNIEYLSHWLRNKPALRFEVIIFYTPDLDIKRLAETYTNLRWWRILQVPRNRIFLIRKFSQKVRSDVLIYVSNWVLISKADIISLGNACQKKDVVFSFANDLVPVHFPNKKLKKNLKRKLKFRIWPSIGYHINQIRSEIYASLNAPYKVSSFEMFALDLKKLDDIFSTISRKELFELFRERFAHSKSSFKKREKLFFENSFLRLISGSGKKIHPLGKGISRWMLPTHFWFFPLFLSLRQLFLILRLEIGYKCGIRMLNYKRIFLLVSSLGFFIFLVLSYLGYKDSWLLFIFFIVSNIPMVLESNSGKINLKLLVKPFLSLLV